MNRKFFLCIIFLSSVNLSSLPDNCLKAADNGCTKCDVHYANYYGRCACEDEGYTSHYYSVNSGGGGEKCIKEIADCDQYDRSDPDGKTCLKCKKGRLSDDKTKCSETVTTENCLAEDETGVCTECKEGYGLNGNKCDKCPTNAYECYFRDGALDDFDCNDGYGLDDKQENCIQCKTTGCSKCIFFGNTEVCTDCLYYGEEDEYSTINNDDYIGYSKKCPSSNPYSSTSNTSSAKYLMASSLVLLLLF